MGLLQAGNRVAQRIAARSALLPASLTRGRTCITEERANVTVLPLFPLWSYVGCALVAFVFHLALSGRLLELHAFGQYDVLFNADPNEGLVNLSHGWGKSEFKHLTLTYLFSPFARLFAMAVSALSLSSIPEAALRERFALGMLAAFSAVRAVLFLNIGRFLGLRLYPALLLGTLAFFAFSNLMFGGIPESFPLSATCIVAGYHLALRPGPGHPVRTAPDQHTRRKEWLLWGMLFVIGSGITITNVIPLGVLLFVRQLRVSSRSIAANVRLVAITMGLAIGANLALAATAKRLQQSRTVEIGYSPATDQYVHAPSGAVVRSLARAFGNGVLAGKPSLAPLTLRPGKVGWYTTRISYELGNPVPPSGWIGLAFVVAGVGLGIAGYHQLRAHRTALWGSIAIVLSNVAIHLFFGDEYVLYSLHWHYSLMVIMAGALLLVQSHRRRGLAVLVGALVAVIAACNLARVYWVVDTLESSRLAAPLQALTRARPGRGG